MNRSFDNHRLKAEGFNKQQKFAADKIEKFTSIFICMTHAI